MTREFFWNGLLSLCNDRIDCKPLFDGEIDHRLPSSDAKLLRSGIFKAVGKFMAHSAIHAGMSFFGLSEAASEYILTDPVDSDTPLPLTINDISDMEIRASLDLVSLNNFILYIFIYKRQTNCFTKQVNQLKEGASLTQEELDTVTRTAEASDFMDPVNSHSASLLFDHILYYNVIEKRTRQLEAIKDGFKSAGVFDFFSNKKYLVPAIFPRTKDLEYPCSLIVDRIRSTSSHEIVSYVKEYVVERSTRK